MKAMRRFGLLLFVLVMGIIIGNLGTTAVLLTVAPLFLLWLMIWDDRKYQERQRQNHPNYAYYQQIEQK